MDVYAPPFSIDSEMLSLVGSISEKIGRISVEHTLDSRPHLRRSNQIRSIHSTLVIEANSLSLDQVRDVIAGRAVLGSAREIREVKNAYAAYDELPRIDPFRLSELLRLHGVMTDQLVTGSGAFRSGEEGVFNGDQCIFMAPPARLVPQLMRDLFDWMNRERQTLHPLILSAVFHYEFVFIHPFSDGNGRMARLWHTALLYAWKPIFAYIPIESRIEQCQEGYYDAIAACHRDGSSDVFIRFMLRQIDAILDELLSRVADGAENVSDSIDKLLRVMDYGVEYSAAVLMERLHLRSKENFRKQYLHPAIERGLVRRTIPDKPSSKKQKYVRV